MGRTYSRSSFNDEGEYPNTHGIKYGQVNGKKYNNKQRLYNKNAKFGEDEFDNPFKRKAK